MDGGDDVYFLIHVMKTGGTSFVFYMREVLGAAHVYPARDGAIDDKDHIRRLVEIERLRALPAAERARMRGYSGHWPAFAADLVGATRTVTFLRHPVDRTISYLKHTRRVTPRFAGSTLEEIYCDEATFTAFIANHQTKIFSMTTADAPRSYMDPIVIDGARLEAAKERLSRVDIVGVQEDWPAAIEAVRAAFGWPAPVEEHHAFRSRPEEVSASLRERIAADNPYDVELYDWAVRTVAAGRVPG